jgi:hypothetical protein
MIQLKKCWIDSDDILYGYYTIGGYNKLILFNFLQSLITTWQMYEYGMGVTLGAT